MADPPKPTRRDPSTLGYVLLGVIARGPVTGYDLAAYIKQRVSHYFSTHLSQIYPELAKLRGAGLVDVEVVTQKKRPAKKLYTLTNAGRASLRAWVVSPTPLVPAEILVRTHAVWLADHDDAAASYLALAENCAAERAHFEEVLARMPSDPDPKTPLFSDVANLRFGVAAMKQQEEWARRLAARLQS
jgi:PadR family transcriptional regulator, regulatory protein AphA